jgi:5'-nucleotidase
VIELDGESIWTALEASLEKWPARGGRFPVISGFRVTWDSRRPPGQRVLSVHLETELADSVATSINDDPSHDGLDEEIKRERGGRKYKVVTREYLAQGHDGYAALKDGKYLIDDESGQMMSTVVRKYLLGACVFVVLRSDCADS